VAGEPETALTAAPDGRAKGSCHGQSFDMSGYFDGPRFRAQLIRHIGDGRTLVKFAQLDGIKVVHDEIEIPTEQIPADLRDAGSVFLVSVNVASLRKDSAENGIAEQPLFRISRLPRSPK
jgi:hypothetical protein